ncbi:hypothetical protein BRAS3843_2550027 [Bradyrhizobium sp. STM 3843]|nr:hypothetical protein BRAS3843_2550027 [Bradyrhizobium sp. STM 3843]
MTIGRNVPLLEAGCANDRCDLPDDTSEIHCGRLARRAVTERVKLLVSSCTVLDVEVCVLSRQAHSQTSKSRVPFGREPI